MILKLLLMKKLKHGDSKRRIYLLLFLIIQPFMICINSQQVGELKQITGKVVDSGGADLPGVSIVFKGTQTGVITDENGNFILKAKVGDILVFSFIGMDPVEFKVGDQNKIRIVLEEQTKGLDEVVIVGFGKQKKGSLVSSISTVNMKEIKGPTSNLTNMLTGHIAGLISYQRSGEPGQDNSQFFIRGVGSFGAGKVNPLILIDGIESSSTDLSRLQPDDIDAFSVLKDATASAVYGARGANGVILVSTKAGKQEKTKFNFRFENSISSNTRNFKFADNVTYMNLANEAALTRDPLATLPYNQNKIEHTKNGDNPLLYPDNHWIDQLVKDYTVNQRFNMNLSGGGKIAQYYIAGTFNIDNGVLRGGLSKGFDNNIKLKNYSVRANTNINLTPSTVAIVRVYGQFDDYNGPIGGGGEIFKSAIWANPVMFPASYPASMSPFTKHEMFGNAIIPGTKSLYENPYARMVSGYQTYNTSNFMTQIELKQDLKKLIPGLNLRVMGYLQRYSYFDTSRHFDPFFYTATIDEQSKTILHPLNDGGVNSIGTVGTEYLSYNEGGKNINSTYYGEFALNYERTFNKVHNVGGLLIGTIRNYVNGNAGNLQASLPARNMGLSGRASYNYNSKYFLEYNFGYNGSERFAKNNRWGFFPSIGAGWSIAAEKFWMPLKDMIGNFKLRVSYGLVGNDQIGDTNDRFFYLSNVNLNDGGRGYTFGELFSYYRNGVSVSRYANDLIGWEESRQLNLAVDISIKDLNITAEYFRQKRSNILMTRSYLPSTMGLFSSANNIRANVGKVDNSGIDVSMDYNKYFANKTWIQGRANFTYAHNEVKVYDEPTYAAKEYYRTRIGRPVNQEYGYIAERLFIDDQDIANSPKQNFGKYLPGDIKYRDMNQDGQITDADKVPIGFPTSPEINYGFGLTYGWKNFDINAFFQGSARSSFFINPSNITPFVMNGGKQNGLLKSIADDHWSEDYRNIYAFWPRLSDKQIENNNQNSTWWMRNGAFLRLKSVELGYNMPEHFLKKFGVDNLRIYLNAANLFAISKFKMWDPEMGGDGLGYPIQQVYNIGIMIGF